MNDFFLPLNGVDSGGSGLLGGAANRAIASPCFILPIVGLTPVPGVIDPGEGGWGLRVGLMIPSAIRETALGFI